MKKNLLIILIIIIVFLASLFYWWGVYAPKEPYSIKTIIFVVQKGEGDEEIAFNLEKQGIIKNRYFFQVYALLRRVDSKLQAGKYELSPAINIPEIVNKFVLGDVIKEKITIIEGWNLRDIGWYFENKGMFQAEELYELKNLEGYLFPDSYEISPEDGIEKIIEKMRNNFDKKLTPELREEIENQGKTISEIVTTASLLEKEVKTTVDKKIVSGILWKRLKNNIPLQVDATIIYILRMKTINPEGVASRPYGARILKEDLEIDSPYNTYKYKGLPFGPICNPGMESILAAIYPIDSDFWYYLSAPEETIFSKTLEEHNLAKQEYLR